MSMNKRDIPDPLAVNNCHAGSKKYIMLTLSLLDSHKTIPGPPRCS